MVNSVFVVSIYAELVGNLVLLVLSLVYCYRPGNPSYLKTFPFYCLINGICDIINFQNSRTINNPHPNLIVESLTYDLYTIFEQLFVSYFISQLIQSLKVRRLIWLLNIFSLSLSGFAFARIGFARPLVEGTLLESIILIFFIMIYFREILVKPYKGDLSKEPAFWIVTGFAFYFFLYIPTILFSSYFIYIHVKSLARSVYSINNYAQIISDVLFIKGITCQIK